MRLVTVALMGIGMCCFLGNEAYGADCDQSRKKLGATRRKSSQLQGKLRKLLTAKSLTEAQKSELNKVQETLGALSDDVESLESAVKACPAAAKAKPAKAKPVKAPAKVKAAPKKPAVSAKAPPSNAVVVAKPAPVAPPRVVVAAAPAPMPTATPPTSSSSVSMSTAGEAVCSGGPTVGDDPVAVALVAPPSVVAWRERSQRHASNRRAVDWAAESPHRCIQRGAP